MFANTTAQNNTNAATAALHAMLSALLRAARTAGAFVRDALCSAMHHIVTLIKRAQHVTPNSPVPTPATAKTTKTTTTSTTLTTSSLNDPAATTASAATPSPTSTLLPTCQSFASIAAARPCRRRTPGPTMRTYVLRSTSTTPDPSLRRPSATASIWTTMRAVGTNAMAAGAPPSPNAPSIEPSDIPTVFDDLLLPPAFVRWTPAARVERYRSFSRNLDVQAALAQRRMRVATELRETEPPLLPRDPAEVSCGCGFCPDGTAAYPMCAAVTMRRTMRSFGARAVQSHIGTFTRRRHACGRYDPTAITSGGRVRT